MKKDQPEVKAMPAPNAPVAATPDASKAPVGQKKLSSFKIKTTDGVTREITFGDKS